jgi:hypothetical protein
MGNMLKPAGIDTAKELGRDFKVFVDLLREKGYPLWKEGVPVEVIWK